MAGKFPIVKQIDGENPWVTYLKYRVFSMNNCNNTFFTGMPGSGKSWAMLSIACLIDPDFQLEGNWYFKAGKLMKAIKEDNHKPGKMWCYDESGIDLSSKNWQSEINKGFNAFFSTARHRRYIFFGSVPFLSFVSKGVRTLMTSHFEAIGWTNRNQTKLIPRVTEYNGEMDKFYKKRLIVKSEGGSTFCNKVLIPKPPKRIVLEYEKLKKEFTSDLFETISENIEAYEEKQNAKKEKGLTRVQQEYVSLLKEGKNKSDISLEKGVNEDAVKHMIRELREKGYQIIPFKKDKQRILSYRVIEPEPPKKEYNGKSFVMP